MKEMSQEIDLSILTDEARREIVDFYQFLVVRYKRERVKKKQRFKKMISKPLKVKGIVIPPREDLYER